MDYLSIAKAAWHRCKAEEDPEFDHCLPAFRNELAYRARNIAGGAPELTEFGHAVDMELQLAARRAARQDEGDGQSDEAPSSGPKMRRKSR